MTQNTYHPQTAKLIASVAENMPEMPSDIMQGWIENPKGLNKFLKGLCPPQIIATDAQAQLSSWIKFYASKFGIKLNPDEIEIPEPRDRFTRLIVVAKGVTPQKVFMTCKTEFSAWSYSENLDRDVPTNDRDPKKGTYAIWVRETQEADDDLKNLSANDIEKRSITTMTLLERLLYELKFFMETGKHLDMKNITLCAGSRSSDGGVPGVRWGGDGLCVYWYGPDDAGSDLRARAVVS